MRGVITDHLPLPSLDDARVVVPAPGSGPGNWAGAATATFVEGQFWLAYRVRRPLTDGRGVAVVVATSSDGEHFATVTTIRREAFASESFERPALVKLPEGGWRLYLSCATPGSKHWWVDSLTADDPAELASGQRRVVLPGSTEVAVKDPVFRVDETGWHLWLCCHPLTEVGHEDRMTTRYLTSGDGLDWTDRGEVLAGRPGSWDARGARLTTVLKVDPFVVLYDGRPDAASNWHEHTGVARSAGFGERLVADDHPHLSSPVGRGALRYASAVELPDGSVRFFFEAARADGAHDLVTSLWRP